MIFQAGEKTIKQKFWLDQVLSISYHRRFAILEYSSFCDNKQLKCYIEGTLSKKKLSYRIVPA